MHVFRVGIVGAGPGGLMTAYALQRLADQPVSIALFEATGRLGGKILTPTFRQAPVSYESGAAEFYDYSRSELDPLKDLITELGLPMRPMGGPAVVMNQSILSNLDDIRDKLGPRAHDAIVEFDRLAKDTITPQAFYEGPGAEGATPPPGRSRFDTLLGGISEPTARAYLESLTHSDLATEPERTTVDYGLQNYLMNDDRYLSLYAIEGGNERLPRELAARLDATIWLEQPVCSIARPPDQALPDQALPAPALRIVSMKQGEERQDDFDFVVIALPHNHLQSISYPEKRLAAAMQRHHQDYDFPAHYLRISILFDKPFWRDAITDSFWMLDAFGGCCLYDESSRTPGCRHGVLGWLLAGETALEMCAQTDDELIQAALDSLPDSLAPGRTCFVEGVVQRWPSAVSAIPGGLHPRSHDQRHRPEPIRHPTLFMVGDYLFDATLNGVLDSAEYVASWISALMIEKRL